ncbi:MAG: hypothetical protein ACOYLF_15635, partial [Blastocatellia bacterium]
CAKSEQATLVETLRWNRRESGTCYNGACSDDGCFYLVVCDGAEDLPRLLAYRRPGAATTD